jgi:hypothetical protein
MENINQPPEYTKTTLLGRKEKRAKMVGRQTPVLPSIKVIAWPVVKPTSTIAFPKTTSSPEHTYIGTRLF